MDSVDITGMDGEAALGSLHAFCVQNGASDIHFSPEKDSVRLEIRLHGMLEALPPMPPAQYEDILRRIKFHAKLKLNVTTLPQDGQYTFEVEKRTVNVRVATLPTRFGETVTLRLLDPQRGIVDMEKLGFPGDMQRALRELATLPNGLLLVTGPTGSGKTTTLYALLQSLIGTKRNIITLEDPVEYEIKGIVQSEIDPEHDFTFASGLRSVLRHDPNVVLVGEIRDYETAQTAIDASLTGHLVLSTLHTNSAIDAIPRLLSMGVSPYTFAPALRGVLAQRLVRTLRPELRGKTIDASDPSIYDGQMVLPELCTVTPAMRDLILRQESETALLERATSDGMLPMRDWGMTLAEEGFTTKEEVLRVTA